MNMENLSDKQAFDLVEAFRHNNEGDTSVFSADVVAKHAVYMSDHGIDPVTGLVLTEEEKEYLSTLSVFFCGEHERHGVILARRNKGEFEVQHGHFDFRDEAPEAAEPPAPEPAPVPPSPPTRDEIAQDLGYADHADRLRNEEAHSHGFDDFDSMIDELKMVYNLFETQYARQGWDWFWNDCGYDHMRPVVEKYIGRPRITGPSNQGPGIYINGYRAGDVPSRVAPRAQKEPGFLANTAAVLGGLAFGYQASKRMRGDR
jgi:hypothetical protein